MAEPNPTSSAPALSIPEEVQKKFSDLVELIKGSQSMNQEERQYWVDVLLIMTPEQVQNLRSILDNEKKQIDEANRALQKGIQEDESKVKLRFDEIRYKEKKRILQEEEKKSETEETKTEEELLKTLAKM